MNPTLVRWIVAAAWILICLAGLLLLRWFWSRQWLADRLYAEELESELEEGDRMGLLRRWLFLAGYRSPYALQSFVGITLAMAALGMVLGWVWLRSPLYTQALRTLGGFPGGVGEIFLPLIYVGPWVLALILACAPWLVVKSTRRWRVEAIEQDVPVTLELLATLSEAGLGFDAALARLLNTQRAERPLAREMRTFQFDTLSGRPRVECFRRLARRIEVSALNVFISAIVQAEQVGAGVAGVLRQQANDLRDRRREDAMAQAMTLPIKRLFPMMVCFLPGIFVATLGPTFYQFFQYADTILRVRDFGNVP